MQNSVRNRVLTMHVAGLALSWTILVPAYLLGWHAPDMPFPLLTSMAVSGLVFGFLALYCVYGLKVVARLQADQSATRRLS